MMKERDRQAGRQTDRQTDKQTDKQTETKEKEKPLCRFPLLARRIPDIDLKFGVTRLLHTFRQRLD